MNLNKIKVERELLPKVRQSLEMAECALRAGGSFYFPDFYFEGILVLMNSDYEVMSSDQYFHERQCIQVTKNFNDYDDSVRLWFFNF